MFKYTPSAEVLSKGKESDKGPNVKISIIFLQIYLPSVACSPNLDYSTNSLRGVVVESNSAEKGNIGSMGGMRVLYPKDSYTVSGSTYSDTTTATQTEFPLRPMRGLMERS